MPNEPQFLEQKPAPAKKSTGQSTMLYSTLFSGVVRGGAAVIGSIDQASALQNRARIQSEILAQSESVSLAQAQDVLVRARAQSNQTQAEMRRYSKSRKASLAAQGISVDVGSALEEQVRAETVGAFEAMTIQNNAALEAYGYRIAAVNSKTQARLGEIEADLGAKQSLVRGGLAAADAIFSSVGSYQQASRV